MLSLLLVILGIPLILIVFSLHEEVIKHLQIWLIMAIAVLDIVTLVMIIWVYQAILVPLTKLQEAARNIADGNLDFHLEQDYFHEFSILYQEFEEMRRRLKANEEQKLLADRDAKELISNISHDLKTPLTAIRGYVEGILDGVAASPSMLEKYLKTIYLKTNDMDRLIDELAFYSKIHGNKLPYNFEKTFINAFVEGLSREIATDMEAANIAFDYTSNVKSDTIVVLDIEQFKRAVNNIISNAVKYRSETDSHIQMSLKDMVDKVVLEISDNGPGIDQHDLPNIFERFYRSDQSRNSSLGGSGIGLSIVKKIVEDHGGSVAAYSKVHEGTAIVIVLKKYQEK